MNMKTRMNYAVEQRLRFIETMLMFYGQVGRGIIAHHFGISSVQASLDLAEYTRQAPLNMTYSPASKSHVREPHFNPIFGA